MDFLKQNSAENRVVLEVGYVLPWTNLYPTIDLWCICISSPMSRGSWVERRICTVDHERTNEINSEISTMKAEGMTIYMQVKLRMDGKLVG